VPVIDIHTVGAGGGSIAEVDRGGALRVGPESAGADPGPICYGRGEQVTVTDANLLLGRLDVSYPLGGTLVLDESRVRPAFERLSRRLGVRDALAAAQGVVDVANANMEAALRVISVERGHDPRDFTLVTFGGAGGLHAVELASALSIPRILVPAYPGLLSALGVLLSDVVQDFGRTVMLHGEGAAPGFLEKRFADLERRAATAMRREGFDSGRLRLERIVDMRYRGQSFEIGVPYTRAFEAAFHRLHERRYGYADHRRETEVVTLRVRARGLPPKPTIPRHRPGPTDPEGAEIAVKKVRFGGTFRMSRVFERSALRAGNVVSGPALVFEYSASTVIPPGFTGRVDAYLNLLITAGNPP
jgi:N-methylhydantoinase A